MKFGYSTAADWPHVFKVWDGVDVTWLPLDDVDLCGLDIVWKDWKL